MDTLDSLDQGGVLKIAIVGKYTGLQDAYLSVSKALEHAAIHANRKLDLTWVESSDLEESKDQEKYQAAWDSIKSVDGILVPGGFGSRGADGKIEVIKYARENKVPFFGICLGMQLAVIEFTRNVVGISNVDTEEYNEEGSENVIVFMPEISKTTKGGTMRLGSRHTYIKDNESLAAKVYYGQDSVFERHRHRYEVNTKYRERIEAEGLIFSGEDIKKERMEIIEIPDHPFFVGTQYHPEFTSRPFKPNPVFYAFALASSG